MFIDADLLDEPQPEYIQRGSEGTGRLKLAHVHVWRPSNGRRVDIESIEKTIVRLHQRFQFGTVAYDPWQAIPAEQVPFSTTNLRAMCATLLEAFREQNINLYGDDNLLTDLRSLRVVEKSYGVRLDSPRGPNGHGDSATALALALHAVSKITDGLSASVAGELVCYP